jgi:hypothetical protein
MKKPDQKKVAVEVYEQAADYVAEVFTEFYFEEAGFYWIAEEIGGMISVNDHFFSLGNMVDYIRNEYTVDQMFKHYDYTFEEAMEKRSPINIKNWRKLGK